MIFSYWCNKQDIETEDDLAFKRKEGHRKNVHYLEQLVVVFEEKDEGKQEDDVFSVLAKQSDEC